MAEKHCDVCNKEYSPDCDYRQGRCPHHEPMVKIQPKDTSRAHFYISLVKSGLRLVACYHLAFYNIQYAALLFAAAELLGIAEELF